MNKKKIMLFSVIALLLVAVLFFVLKSKNDYKVVDFDGEDSSQSNDEQDEDEKKTDENNDRKKAEEHLKSKDKDEKLNEDDVELIEAHLSGVGTDALDYDNDLGYPVFEYDEDATETTKFGIKFYKPQKVEGFLEDSSHYDIHQMIRNKYIPFRSYSGNVFGIVNTKDGYSRKTYEKNVYRYDVNPDKNEFVFLKSLGDSMELHHKEIGPSVSEVIRDFDGIIKIKNGIIFNDMYFFSYGKADSMNDEAEGHYTEVIPFPYEEDNSEPYKNMIDKYEFNSFGTNGDKILAYSKKDKTLYDITGGNPTALMHIPEANGSGQIWMSGENYTVNVVGEDGNLVTVSNVSGGQIDFDHSFTTLGFLTDEIVLGMVDNSHFTVYNLKTNEYEHIAYVSGSIAIDRESEEIYFRDMDGILKMKYNIIDE